MSKKVVSFRLSDQELLALDEACRRLGMNRSQVVSAGVTVLLKEYVHEDGTLLRRVPWILTPLTSDDDETPRSE
jgi:hypothetical protein